MIGVAAHLKSHVSKDKSGTAPAEFPWCITTPQNDHMFAPTWDVAMELANFRARQAQLDALR